MYVLPLNGVNMINIAAAVDDTLRDVPASELVDPCTREHSSAWNLYSGMLIDPI